MLEKSTLEEILWIAINMLQQGFSTSIKQTQKLDTSLLQVIDILTMPTLELNEKIKEEAEKNPVLEIKDNDTSFEDYSTYKNNIKRSDYSDEANGKEYSDENNGDWFEKTVCEKESLEEHLLKELGCLDLSTEVRETAETLISGLDQYGFTGSDPSRLITKNEEPYLLDAIKAVQSLEPTGVGARDWREALMLQINEIEKDKCERIRYKEIIYNGLDYIKNGEETKLARALRIGKEDLDEMIKVIKTLTPFPGLKYSSDYNPYITPELSFHNEDGKIVMKVLSRGILDVVIDDSYLALKDEIKDKKDQKDKEANKYLKEKIANAQNLINLLSLRKNTLERLGKLLIERQHDFFLYGPMFLRGLTMTETAQELGVNVSTVSKLAQEKYILTDWGTFPLRFFFSSEIKKDGGGDLSKNAIKLKIKEILDSNTSGKKLSDQKITDCLNKEGLQIARRTVNKYRLELENEKK